MKNKHLIAISLAAVLALTALLIIFSAAGNGSSDKNEYIKQTSGINTDLHVYSGKPTIETVLCTAVVTSELCAENVPMEKLPVQTVSFIACGDNLVHGSVYTDAMNLATGTEKEYNFINRSY